MFRLFKRKSAATETPVADAEVAEAPRQPAAPVEPAAPDAAVEAQVAAVTGAALARPSGQPSVDAGQPQAGWFGRLRHGLRKTGAGISGLFGGLRVDESLFDELESALILADAGTAATTHVLQELRRKVRTACAETRSRCGNCCARCWRRCSRRCKSPWTSGAPARP